MNVTVNAHDGDDSLAISDVGPDGITLTMNTGDGANTVTVNQSMVRDNAGNLTINANLGSNELWLQNLPQLSHTTANLAGDASTIDVAHIRGRGIPSTSSIEVNGNLSTAFTYGDGILYDGEGATIANSSATEGQITLTDHGTVAFKNFNHNNASLPDQLFVVAAPRPRMTLVPTIAEGAAATLRAVDDAGQSHVIYGWDLNGDGDFSDAEGAEVTLSWQEWRSLGINDDGVYPIAVRAIASLDSVAFGGQQYQLSADVTARTARDQYGTDSLCGFRLRSFRSRLQFAFVCNR